MTEGAARAMDQIQDDVVPQEVRERKQRKQLQDRTQEVVMALRAEQISDDRLVVRDELLRRLEAADTGHHSDKWLDDTAGELAAGHAVILGMSQADEVRDQVDGPVPDGGEPAGDQSSPHR